MERISYMKKMRGYFTRTELLLWGASSALTAVSFAVFDRKGWLTLAASLIGVTSLIFNAKGNPAGQALMVIFSALYGVISYSCAYYGEMITYLGMCAPIALLALAAWLKNPYGGNRSEVRVNRLKGREIALMLALSAAVTAAFWFILGALGTANPVPSTISVTTSFIAAYLTFRRSRYFPLAYAANDAVLLVLWTLAAVGDVSYISVLVCFVVFLINDLYGFVSWSRMEKRQNKMVQV